jgi:hypothetical protein
MLKEIQEPDRESVSESEIPTEPHFRAISPTSQTADSRCVTVQEPLPFHSVPTVGLTQQESNQQADNRSIQSFGSRVVSGTIFTISSTDVLLQCLEEAAMIHDCCVSLLVLDEHGWHELFLNRRCTKSHSITASYLRDIVANNDLDLWMERNSTCSDSNDEHEIGEIKGYQLVVYNHG